MSSESGYPPHFSSNLPNIHDFTVLYYRQHQSRLGHRGHANVHRIVFGEHLYLDMICRSDLARLHRRFKRQ